MRRTTLVRVARLGLAAAALLLAGGALFNVAALSKPTKVTPAAKVDRTAQRTLDDGRHVFRQDTFGDESFWTGVLQLNRAIAGAKNGGAGSGGRAKAPRSARLKGGSSRP